MNKTIPKGTIYDLDPFFGYRRAEGRDISHGTWSVAQFRNAVFVRFTPRGKRKQTSVGSTSHPSIVVLEGWGHPDLGRAVESEEFTADGRRYPVERPKYIAGSGEWEELFSSQLDQYVRQTGVRILVDYRGHVMEIVRIPEDPEIAALLDEIEEEMSGPRDPKLARVTLPAEIPDSTTYIEGATSTVAVNAFERNRRARRQCIAHYGALCFVCGLSFEDYYGAIGQDFIEVHHVVPLSEIGEAYEVDPVRDLRPVCSNCHSMLHRRVPPFAPEHLRDLIAGTNGRT